MNTKPKPKRVLACRPGEQNTAWVEFLRTRGLDVLDIPLLKIADIEIAENKQRIKDLIIKLDQFDYLIFISQNAVKHAFEWIDDFWPQLPEQQSMFAIGKKTALAVRDICESYYPSSVPQLVTNKGAMNSEALLEHAAMREVAGKKILIFKGIGGRKYLEDSLLARGALVEACALYERSLPDEAVEAFAEIRFDQQRDVFVVFSGETLANLHTALQLVNCPDKTAIPLVVPGERVEALAQELGFRAVYRAENASEDSMWQTLTRLFEANRGASDE